MTGFDDREKAAENKYAHDNEVTFLINARYHKMLAKWVVEKTGILGAEADDYISHLVTDDIDQQNENVLFDKVRHDLLVHDIHIIDHDIQEEMYNIQKAAREQILNGKK